QVVSARYTRGPVRRDGSAATASYTADLTLRGLGGYRYQGQLPLVRQGGTWKAAPTLASVHPALREGTRLAVTRELRGRGRLLDRSGQPLRADPELAGNLLGSIGPLSAAQATAAGPQFRAGDRAGVSGLERVYNTRLAGTPGGTIVLKDAGGATVQTLQQYPGSPGEDVRTTLDLPTQRAGETAMSGVSQPDGALTAIDTRTGGVLALVNHPLNGYGRATRGVYPPGSTFKVVTATAALMNGRTPATPLPCPDRVSVEGRSFANAEKEQLGTIPFRTAFAKSCNTAFINLALSLPRGAVGEAARMYGFDGSEPLPIKSVGGSYPLPTDTVDAASAAIGQGRVTASPLQMASVAAAAASGTWRRPFVTGAPTASRAIPPQVDATLRDFMRAVVTEGTAASVPFPGTVYGKTGTAEYGAAGPGGNPPTHAWFVGFRGPVAFAVVVEDGGFGAQTAAPAAARFLAALGPG
ncbi:MAG TPA: penicillin-binding transpeptidase domain-containing protein, partial [Frankiaceae bacterium]|nr:penicillin-binding transpeptidase domain-containing protein [Frankiaceae bacterium]